MDKRSFFFVLCVTTSFLFIHSWFHPQEDTSYRKEVQQKALTSFKGPLVAQNTTIMTRNDESFYVLENGYQQLVFSTKGGALAEINLPYKSAKNPDSLVKPIEIDRKIQNQTPLNSRFPLKSFYRATSQGSTLISEGQEGGYYPLLRRPLLNEKGNFLSEVPSNYYALNLVGDDPAVSEAIYHVKRFEKNLIEFQANVSGRRITKTFWIPKDRNGPYCLQLDVQVDGDPKGLWLSSGVPDVEMVAGNYTPLLRYQTVHLDSPDVETISLPKKEVFTSDVHPNWISNNNGFFGLILDPLENTADGYSTSLVEGDKLPSRLSLIDAKYDLYPPSKYPGYLTYLPLSKSSTSFRVFAGPYDNGLLKELDGLFDEPLKHYNPEYTSAQSIRGWFSFISEPFAKFLFFLMQGFYWITRSWAASIVLLTIALRLMMYPLNSWSIKSMAKMQEIQPQIQALQEKYKKDPRKLQLEIANFYRENKMNPVSGCLPMFLQMPFLVGMFYLLKSSFPLRGAVFIPGWINDLAAPDVVFSWGPPLWLIGNELHLLPLLMGAAVFVQQKMSQKKLPKNQELNDSQKQQKAMGPMMSVLLTVMFYSFPSGLNLYFMFSTLLGMGQQWWIKKQAKPS